LIFCRSNTDVFSSFQDVHRLADGLAETGGGADGVGADDAVRALEQPASAAINNSGTA
jgi:hypothetical protein